MRHDVVVFKTSSQNRESPMSKRFEFCGHVFNPENISRYGYETGLFRGSLVKIQLKTGETINLRCDYKDFLDTISKYR